MELAQAYAKLLGPQVSTTTVSQPGSLGQGIQAAIGTIIPYYMMTQMQKNTQGQQSSLIEQLIQIARMFAPELAGSNAVSGVPNNPIFSLATPAQIQNALGMDVSGFLNMKP